MGNKKMNSKHSYKHGMFNFPSIFILQKCGKSTDHKGKLSQEKVADDNN